MPARPQGLDRRRLTEGFAGSVAVAPMESALHAWAGAARDDWIFVPGLFGALAAVGAGATWRLGKAWARLPLVGRDPWPLREPHARQAGAPPQPVGCTRPFVSPSAR